MCQTTSATALASTCSCSPCLPCCCSWQPQTQVVAAADSVPACMWLCYLEAPLLQQVFAAQHMYRPDSSCRVYVLMTASSRGPNLATSDASEPPCTARTFQQLNTYCFAVLSFC